MKTLNPTAEQFAAIQARIKATAKRVQLLDTPALKAARQRSEQRHGGTGAKLGRPRASSVPSFVPEASEHQSQVAVIQWWSIHCRRWGLDERCLFGIPNAGAGASKGQAGKMKAEGTRAGVPDLFLALPLAQRVGTSTSSGTDSVSWGQPALLFAGCFIELKRKGGKPTLEQASYHYLLRSVGYNVIVAHGYDEAVQAITAYCDRTLK